MRNLSPPGLRLALGVHFCMCVCVCVISQLQEPSLLGKKKKKRAAGTCQYFHSLWRHFRTLTKPGLRDETERKQIFFSYLFIFLHQGRSSPFHFGPSVCVRAPLTPACSFAPRRFTCELVVQAVPAFCLPPNETGAIQMEERKGEERRGGAPTPVCL